MTGHKNMGRPVAPTGYTGGYYTPGYPWAGADGSIYGPNPSPWDWANGLYNTDPLLWIYDGWMATTPRYIRDKAGGENYSCGRCHMTGWTSDAAVQATKEPEAMFPGISWDGVTSKDNKVNLAGGIAGDTNQYSSWDRWGIQCSRCHAAEDAGHATFPDSSLTGADVGAAVNALCTQCHRQENGGKPYTNGTCTVATATNEADCINAAGTWTETAGVLPVMVGDAHGHTGIISHPAGNEFLNSPHGKFSGTFAEINVGANYDSHFTFHEGGGCTACHDVHKSTVEAANPDGGAVEECQGCHTGAYAKPLDQIGHVWGVNTPLDPNVFGDDPARPCEICHMPEGLHLWRINTDPSYSIFPPEAATANVPANTAPDGDFADAVWVDLDHACGQCHGGGTTEDAGHQSQLSQCTGPGTPYECCTGVAAGSCALYRTRATLAPVAAAMHGNAPVSYQVTFNSVVTSTVGGFDVAVNAVVNCGGACPTLDYDWDWGDGTANGTGNPASHSYTSGGSKTITLTVKSSGLTVGTVTRNVTGTALDAPPTASATCTWEADTWTMTVVDGSTDDDVTPVSRIVVDWGDGTLKAVGGQGGTFTHTYLTAGTFTPTVRAVDTAAKGSTYTCGTNATPMYFTISGTVETSGGTLLGGATITVKKGGIFVKRVYSASVSGVYSAGGLRPGTYTLTTTKAGYTFANQTVTVGPDQTGQTITAN